MGTDGRGNAASRELGYCPCCGYRALPEGRPGSYDVCPYCNWTDDPTQFANPEAAGEPNDVSLQEARENFREHGAAHPDADEETQEPPSSAPRDPNWPY